MNLFIRKILFALIGLTAGLIAWPLAETVLNFQANFPNLLLFNIVLGLMIGLVMGGCFGMIEGITLNSKPKIKTGVLTGILIGGPGGVIGLFIGQMALLLIGTTFFNSAGSFQKIGLPISKAAGWAVFGGIIGIVEGVRSRSLTKVRNGIIGGFIGGLLGGYAVEFLNILFPGNAYSRLAGFVILGILIGTFYGFIENRLAFASLLLLNGKDKGKEFLLTQRKTTIGSSSAADIEIQGYKNIGGIHSSITKQKKEFVYENINLPDEKAKTVTFINDGKIGESKLSNGDIIRIGNAQFQFNIL
jgi:hypothetical protein